MHSFFRNCLFLSFCSSIFGTTITVDTTQDNPSGPIMGTTLRDAINQINMTPGNYDVVFNLPANSEILLDAGLPPLNISSAGTSANTVTFNTMSTIPLILNGQSTNSFGFTESRNLFFVVDGNVTIQNMVLKNGYSQGGTGHNGGGGGLGAGGAVFVNNGVTCTLIDCTMTANAAVGGTLFVPFVGSPYGGGGGGMLLASGGEVSSIGSSGSGGGGLGEITGIPSSNGGEGSLGGIGGSGGGLNGGTGGNTGATGDPGNPGGVGGGGGGGGSTTNAAGIGAVGGTGGDFGGGGGGGKGGNNGASVGLGGDGGMGGWGGGGGGCGFQGNMGTNAPGGFGGGQGTSNSSATETGGNAFGGAIFVRQGGTLTIQNSNSQNATNNLLFVWTNVRGVVPDKAGTDLYLDTGVDLTFEPGASSTFTLGNTAGPGAITVNGAGTLALSNVANSFAGGTSILSGTLAISQGGSLGSGAVTFTGNGTLQFLLAMNLSHAINVQTFTGTFDTDGNAVTISSVISGSGTVGVASSQGSGVLTLTANNSVNTWSTNLASGTLSISSPTNIGSGSVAFSGASTLSLTGNSAFPMGQAFSIGAGITGTIDVNGTSSSIAAAISGATGSLTLKSSTGTGTLSLTGANTYGGTTTIQSGKLALVTGGSITSSFVSMTGGTFDISAASGNRTIANLSGSAGSVVLGNNSLSLGSDNQSHVFAGTISGNGGLTKTGAGTFTLSNANTYSGGTTISTGTLALSGSGSLLSTGAVVANGTFNISAATPSLNLVSIGDLTGSGFVTLGANTLIVNTTGADNFTGVIQGTGSLIKQGSTTLTLSNANTYSGGTVINAGTLQLNAVNALNPTNGLVNLSSVGTLDASLVTAGPTVTLPNLAGVSGSQVLIGANELLVGGDGNSQTFSGVISGSGIVSKTGAGTLSLAGVNTYTGNTIVAQGTLALSGDGNFPDSPLLNVQGPGTFDISQASGGFFSLIEINSLTGAGTVQLGTNNLIVNELAPTTFSGTIAGTGSLFKSGPATLTLTGSANSITGLLITQATLVLSGGFTVNPTAFLVLSSSGADLDITGITSSIAFGDLTGVSGTTIDIGTKTLSAGASGNTTYEGTISGTGNFIKTGSGSLNFTGANSIGSTTVADGTLFINGTLTSPVVTIGNGGSLRGVADVVGNVTVQNGGTAFPGNSIGSQTYVGNLTFQTGGIFGVEVDPTSATFLDVTGSASLTGGIIALTLDPGQYPAVGAPIPVLTAAGGLGGTEFASLSVMPGFQGGVFYDATTVFIFLNQEFFPVCSQNYSSLIAYLNNVLAREFPYIVILGQLVEQSCSDIINGLDTLSPASNTTASFGAVMNALETNEIISSHIFTGRFARARSTRTEYDELALVAQLGDLPPVLQASFAQEQGYERSVWMTGFYNRLHEEETRTISSFNLYDRGFFLGCDAQIGPCGFWGAGAGYGNESLHLSHDTDGSVQSVAAAFYGTWTGWDDFFIDGILLGSYNQISNHRHIFFPGFDGVADSSHNDWQLVPHLGFGYSYLYNSGCLQPYVLLDCVFSWEESYNESNASLLNMHQDDRFCSFLRTEVGLAAFQDWKTCIGWFLLRETIAYVNRAPLQKGNLTPSFAGLGLGSFNVSAFNRTENLVAPSIEAYFQANDGVYVVLDGEGEFGSKSDMYNVRFTVGKYF